MKTVAEVIGVSRSNLVERLQQRPPRRIGRPPLPDEELVRKFRYASRLHKQVLQHSRDCAECEEQLRSPRCFRQE